MYLMEWKTMNQELELVESMDKLSDLMRKFQTQLRKGDLKEYTLRQLYYIELIDKNQGISVSELAKKLEVKKSTVSIAINQLIDLVMQNLLPIETAAQCAKMTLDEFKVAMDKNEILLIFFCLIIFKK